MQVQSSARPLDIPELVDGWCAGTVSDADLAAALVDLRARLRRDFAGSVVHIRAANVVRTLDRLVPLLVAG